MAFQAKIIRHVTLPVIKFAEGVARYVKIIEAMHVGRKLKNDDKKEPATLAQAIDLETGEIGQLVIPSVVKSTLEEEYPGQSYVGKCFSITKTGQRVGKAYNDFRVVEIEDPNPESSPVGAKGKGGK